MTLAWRRCARLPRPPWPTTLAFGAWAGAVLALSSARGGVGVAASPCWFRHATGIPCPTCGGTRCVTAAWRGDLAGAFAANPFVATAIAALGLALLVRIVAGRRPRVDGLTSDRAWLGVGLACALCWGYRLARGE